MAKENEAELDPNQSPAQFYRDYIQNNLVFYEMPDSYWDKVKEHAEEILKDALTLRGNEWEVTEAAVRRFCVRNKMTANW